MREGLPGLRRFKKDERLPKKVPGARTEESITQNTGREYSHNTVLHIQTEPIPQEIPIYLPGPYFTQGCVYYI